jgi:hypothetical protein
VIKAWDTAAERIRILCGKPMPGSRRPAPEAAKIKPKKLRPAPGPPGPRPVPVAPVWGNLPAACLEAACG